MLRQSAIRHNPTSTQQIEERTMQTSHDRSHLARSTLVSRSTGHDNRHPDSPSAIKGPLSTQLSRKRITNERTQLELSRLGHIRKSKRYRGLSKQAFELITTKVVANTKKHYDSHWRIFALWWNKFYGKSQIQAYQVANFLFYLRRSKKLASPSINSYRAAHQNRRNQKII